MNQRRWHHAKWQEELLKLKDKVSAQKIAVNSVVTPPTLFFHSLPGTLIIVLVFWAMTTSSGYQNVISALKAIHSIVVLENSLSP
jgi:hypothetical protein